MLDFSVPIYQKTLMQAVSLGFNGLEVAGPLTSMRPGFHWEFNLEKSQCYSCRIGQGT